MALGSGSDPSLRVILTLGDPNDPSTKKRAGPSILGSGAYMPILDPRGRPARWEPGFRHPHISHILYTRPAVYPFLGEKADWKSATHVHPHSKDTL
jgi:hypothetical protein